MKIAIVSNVLMSRGMGLGTYLDLQQSGIRPIVTDIPDINKRHDESPRIVEDDGHWGSQVARESSYPLQSSQVPDNAICPNE